MDIEIVALEPAEVEAAVDALLAGLPHRTAALSTIRAETPALRLCRRRGWQVLLEHFLFPGGDRPYLVMGRVLDGGRP